MREQAGCQTRLARPGVEGKKTGRPMAAPNRNRGCGEPLTGHRRPPLGREAAQRSADVPFAETLERPVAELPYSLARDAEHRADLLQRVLAPAFQPEIQPEHLRVSRGKRRERLLDLV